TRAMQARMEASGETQVSLTDPDARAMATTARHPRIIGYNVQSVVDAEHHLIVAHEVTMRGYDRDALSEMAIAAQEVMTTGELRAIADKEYYNSEELLACERAGITATVPKPKTSGAGASGRYDKEDFVYDGEGGTYRCPAGKTLTYRSTREEAGLQIRRYWTNACPGCALQSMCTTGTERRIRRWEHEDVLERVQQRIAGDPLVMRLRRQTVEHPFGTIKAWMGATHFTMKRLKNVAT
ncbi:transposase, partial [Mangrovicoccus sp. HB161399]|uniref:transposase n=1 Tax=Mangrovicoccus sp. HB161399 TaxID=2720392 RepID=UPI00155457E9